VGFSLPEQFAQGLKKGQSTWKKRDNIVSAVLFMMEPTLTHSCQVLLVPGPSASCLALLLWRKASWRLLVMMCDHTNSISSKQAFAARTPVA